MGPFSQFLSFTNGTKSRKTSHIYGKTIVSFVLIKPFHDSLTTEKYLGYLERQSM